MGGQSPAFPGRQRTIGVVLDDTPESRGNAILMGAAPDLFNSLLALVAEVVDYRQSIITDASLNEKRYRTEAIERQISKARAAIAKARRG